MLTFFRSFVIAISLYASGVAMAAAQTASTLTADQRLQVYRTLIKEAIPNPPADNAKIVTGEVPPAAVQLYPMPIYVVDRHPAAANYKFTVWNNQVVLVNIPSGKVEAIVRE